MNEPDAVLIQSVQNGDERAFEQLVKLYRNPLLNFIFRFVGDRESAEELVQEVFLRVFRAIPSFQNRPDARFSSWIFKIAYNLSVNELKRRKRLSDFLKQEDKDQVHQTDITDSPVVDNRQEQILQAMNHLTDPQKAALWLRVNYEFSYKEIASALNVSVSSVESLIFRARRDLKHHLKLMEMG